MTDLDKKFVGWLGALWSAYNDCIVGDIVTGVWFTTSCSGRKWRDFTVITETQCSQGVWKIYTTVHLVHYSYPSLLRGLGAYWTNANSVFTLCWCVLFCYSKVLFLVTSIINFIVITLVLCSQRVRNICWCVSGEVGADWTNPLSLITWHYKAVTVIVSYSDVLFLFVKSNLTSLKWFTEAVSCLYFGLSQVTIGADWTHSSSHKRLWYWSAVNYNYFLFKWQ